MNKPPSRNGIAPSYELGFYVGSSPTGGSGETMEKKLEKKATKAIHTTIRLLRALTEGQGSVHISVMDAGAGGGWSWGKVEVFLERDGVIGKIESYDSVEEFADALLKMIQARHDGFPARIYDKSKWNEE